MILLFIFCTTFLTANGHGTGQGGEMYFHPKPDTYKEWLFWTVQPTLINFNINNSESYMPWVKKLDDFLEEYHNPHNKTRFNCDDEHQSNSNDIPCNVNINSFGPCSKEKMYGYPQGAPCIFVSLQKQDDFTPDYYNNIDALPMSMPTSTIEYIKRLKPTQRNNIWVSCEGEKPFDHENMGPISFYPSAQFPGYYFPYKNQQNYLSPLVAIQFMRPALGMMVNVRCKAWARNILHWNEKNLGTVSFDLLVD